MIGAAEAAKGIYGAWRLAHGDRSGLAHFDTSIEGFWRSFAAAIVALPAYAVLVGLATADYPGEIHWGGVVLVEGIAYALDWFAFPLAAVYLCRWLDRRGRYTRLIVALNWAKVIEAALMVPAALVGSLAPGGVLAAVPVVLFVALLVYHWFVTRVALDVGAGEAALVTLINLTLSVIIAFWSRSLLF